MCPCAGRGPVARSARGIAGLAPCLRRGTKHLSYTPALCHPRRVADRRPTSISSLLVPTTQPILLENGRPPEDFSDFRTVRTPLSLARPAHSARGARFQYVGNPCGRGVFAPSGPLNLNGPRFLSAALYRVRPMAKKITGYIKLQVPAGAANPSPPI